MKFSESLKKKEQFKNVYEHGVSYADRFIVMYVLENHLKMNRLGISVSKKVGNSVVRHRFVRLVRENYRLEEDDYMCGYDVVVIGRMPAAKADFHRIGRSMKKLAEMHGIIRSTGDHADQEA